MSVPDDYGQGINIASLTDAPDAGKLARELANALAQRGVMRFASASARGATLTSPVEGMLTWLQDVNRLDLYDGSAWVAVSVGTRAWTTISLTSGWSHNGNDNGTFQYRIVNMFGEDVIMFRGGISRASYPSTLPESWILNSSPLPASAWPTTKRTLVVPCSDSNSARITLKMDVQTNGYLSLWGTKSDTQPPWISFNGAWTSL